MASKYFVVLGGSASGIYDTLAEAKNKSRSNDNEVSFEDTVEILEHTSLSEAFKCLQSFKSSQNKISAINSNSQKPHASLEKYAFSSCPVSAEVQYATKSSVSNHITEAEKTTPDVFKKPPGQIRGDPEAFDNKERNKKKLVGAETAVLFSAETKSDKVADNQESGRRKKVKKSVIQTRNVCIQADRGGINKICSRCKNEKQARKLLVENETQTVHDSDLKTAETESTLEIKRCQCSSISEGVSKCHITTVTFDNLHSFANPLLDFLIEPSREKRLTLPKCWLDGKERNWFLRQDTFTLTLYQSKKQRTRKRSPIKTPSVTKRQSPKLVGTARKRTFNKQSAPYKIPKKVKIDKQQKQLRVGQEEGYGGGEEEEEMMDIMLCTQARLKDVTYSSRDIPHDSVGLDYEEIFNDYLSISVTHVIVEDAYIRTNHQIANLVRFINLLVRRTSLAKFQLRTGQSDFNDQHTQFIELKECLFTTRNIEFEFVFDSRLHDRIIKFNNGWALSLGRGLDYFQKSHSMLDRNDMSLRKTRAFRVLTYKCPKF